MRLLLLMVWFTMIRKITVMRVSYRDLQEI